MTSDFLPGSRSLPRSCSRPTPSLYQLTWRSAVVARRSISWTRGLLSRLQSVTLRRRGNETYLSLICPWLGCMCLAVNTSAVVMLKSMRRLLVKFGTKFMTYRYYLKQLLSTKKVTHSDIWSSMVLQAMGSTENQHEPGLQGRYTECFVGDRMCTEVRLSRDPALTTQTLTLSSAIDPPSQHITYLRIAQPTSTFSDFLDQTEYISYIESHSSTRRYGS